METDQEVARNEGEGEKQNARPVAGVARFNIPILVNGHGDVNEKR
jgi:hypothetical protein